MVVVSAFSSNDLESYATTDEVSTIVNNAIESGEIIVSSGFSKFENKFIGNNTVTLSGSGFLRGYYCNFKSSDNLNIDSSTNYYFNLIPFIDGMKLIGSNNSAQALIWYF